MLLAILAASGTIILVSFIPALPPWSVAVTALVMALSISFCPRYQNLCYCAQGVLLGLAFGVGYGNWLLSFQLAPELEGRDVRVVGRVTGLPQSDGRRQRFWLDVIEFAGSRKHPFTGFSNSPRRLLLSWYHTRAPGDQSADAVKADIVRLLPGQLWQLTVRLKRPRGFVNPGAFDYQAWLLRQKVGATGYVRRSDDNRQLDGARYAIKNPLQIFHINADRVRVALLDWLSRENRDGKSAGVLGALLVGDRSAIGGEQWTLLQRTGTNHLVAISGLHIGLLALFGHWFGAGLGRLVNLFFPRVAAGVVASACSLLAAFGYSALAGFSLPTVRALVMVLAIQLALLLQRPQRTGYNLAWALLVVLILDPLAAHDLGFWLSFIAVSCLLLAFGGRMPTGAEKGVPPGLRLLRAQVVIFIGLSIPLLVLVQGVPLASLVTNLLAVPLVSFISVPLLLVAAVLQSVNQTLGHYLLWAADYSTGWLWWWLSWFGDFGDRLVWLPSGPITALSMVIAGAGVLLLLLPRGVPGRWLGGLLIVSALFARQVPAAPLVITVLDVGQGLAVVVETPPGRVLVYDTGPDYGERFDAGNHIIAPYLKRRGFSRVDTLVVSHSDRDHAGGLNGLLSALPVERLLYNKSEGDNFTLDTPVGRESCEQGMDWRWGEVFFRVLSPYAGGEQGRNNRSCTLLISYKGHTVLLPGDIEEKMELRLLRDRQLPQALDLLVAPHHGSITSSTPALVGHTRPARVVYSAGYRSRYGHPHPRVEARYQSVGATAFHTAKSGALRFSLQRSGEWQLERFRETEKRYWFTLPPANTKKP